MCHAVAPVKVADVLQSSDIEIDLYFLATDQQGRSGPVHTGYRPLLFHRGTDWGVDIWFLDVEEVPLGQGARAHATFIMGVRPNDLAEGMPFLLREGHKVVGYGSVRRIFPPDPTAGQRTTPNK